MRRIAVVAAGLLLAAAFALPNLATEPEAAHALTNCDAPDAANSPVELQFLTILNAERVKAGASELKLSPGLNRAAAWKSRDSSAAGPGFSHTDSLGRSPNQRARDCGYPSYMGENVAYGFPGAQAVLNAWMGSSGHKANMLSNTWSYIGIGEYQARWTLDFGTIDDTASAPPPASTPSATPTRVIITPTPFPAQTPAPLPSPTVTSTPAGTVGAAGVQMGLGHGFNLVTFAGGTTPSAEALASLGTHLIGVYQWDGASGQWRRYLPSAPAYVNTLAALTRGEAYFVILDGPALWTY